VENTKATYSIKEEDTYNFDKSGFMMGMISPRAVVTGSERWDGQRVFSKAIKSGKQ
jgi:hypothetical protein